MDNEMSVPIAGGQTELSVRNMLFSGKVLASFPDYVKAIVSVKKSCAVANFKSGGINEEKLKLISSACDSIVAGKHLNLFPVDVYSGGGGVAINMNTNEAVAAVAGNGISPTDDVNMSQSTVDACSTGLRLALYRMTLLMEETLSELVAALFSKGRDFAEINTIARTCWQDGMRVSAGALFTATASALKRQIDLLEHYREQLKKVNLGWTVIGTGTGAGDKYRSHILAALREVTGIDFGWRDDKCDLSQYPDDIAAVSSAVRRIAEIVSKFAKDLRLLSSGPEAGLGELTLPETQAGSSFFPGKVNPVMAETFMQCAMLVGGNDNVVQQALGMGEVHLNIWEPMMGFLVMENITMIINAAGSFTEKCVKGIRINREVCESHAQSKMPLIIDGKERYGYAYLAGRIKKEGIDAVVKSLQQK